LYVLDEPTTGLHFDDVRKLLEVLSRLVDQGNTVIVIEHNLDVVKTADWIVDLGPEGGERGGKVVAEGTPEDVALAPMSYTGDVLAPVLARAGRHRPDRLGPSRPTPGAKAKVTKTAPRAGTRPPAKATTRAGTAGKRRKAG
jgi:excinuclease ABC subunit A